MHVEEPAGNWGGPWTEEKLDAFQKYVRAYLTIMRKRKNFKTLYFDGFAGSGARSDEADERPAPFPLFEDLSISLEEQHLYRGAAERVLALGGEGLLFDYYYFIDADRQALKQLEQRLEERFPSLKPRMIFRASDCNEQLKNLGSALKRDRQLAALVFLDPFGMQISWEAIESLKNTRSDVWILIPTGLAINRLLDRKGELRHLPGLERFFGMNEEQIRNRFYRKRQELSLFGETATAWQKVGGAIEIIANTYIEQMKTIWKHVIPKPLVLRNSRGTPIFHFVFASNNPTALKIAKDIVGKKNQ
ncbi:MAG: three-Cys-motif partner protein TcmP [Gammaproteobacteria bacterium]|nr:MAG: three-Cys-motif partner protein TcmP [Gammaproteobacteria bacterium]